MAEAEVLDRLDEACRLADSITAGARLEPLWLDGLPLLDDEAAYAEVDVGAWRWLAQEVYFERRSMLVGGPMLMATAALVSARGNRRRRLDAERAAAPQWRPLGFVRVVVTDRRLLIWHAGDWWSVWFEAVAGWDIDTDRSGLTLLLKDGAPYRLAGPSVPLLLVALAWLAAQPVVRR